MSPPYAGRVMWHRASGWQVLTPGIRRTEGYEKGKLCSCEAVGLYQVQPKARGDQQEPDMSCGTPRTCGTGRAKGAHVYFV